MREYCLYRDRTHKFCLGLVRDNGYVEHVAMFENDADAEMVLHSLQFASKQTKIVQEGK